MRTLEIEQMSQIEGGNSCQQASTIGNIIGVVGVGLLFVSFFTPVGALAATVIATQGAVATYVAGGLAIGQLIAC